jgi:hypothetical protein
MYKIDPVKATCMKYTNKDHGIQGLNDTCFGICAAFSGTNDVYNMDPACSKSCANFKFGDVCVSSCPSNTFLSSGNVCALCHSECAGGCSGPTATQCMACLHYISAGECVIIARFE